VRGQAKPSPFLVLFTEASSGFDSTLIVDLEALNIFQRRDVNFEPIKRLYAKSNIFFRFYQMDGRTVKTQV
jgi:hypothetical protein